MTFAVAAAVDTVSFPGGREGPTVSTPSATPRGVGVDREGSGQSPRDGCVDEQLMPAAGADSMPGESRVDDRLCNDGVTRNRGTDDAPDRWQNRARVNRRTLLRLAVAAVTFGVLTRARPAAARELSKEERRRLSNGEIVQIPFDVSLPEGDYFGGVSYLVIPASVDAVMAVLTDARAYTRIFPMTIEAKITGNAGPDTTVFLRQGGKRGSAAYSLLVRRESPGLLRFWLDPKQPHDIADCWGYFRLVPWGPRASLVSYGALVRLDFGLIRLLFSEKIRSLALQTPALVKRYMAAR